MKIRNVILAMMSGLAVAGCSKHNKAEQQAMSYPSLKARVGIAEMAKELSFSEVVGTVRPVERAQIAAKLMGTIESLPVTLGMKVRKGDLLVKISAGEVSARLLQAQSQLNQSKRDLDRERELLGKGASTSDLVKNMEDRHALYQAMVREAETMLGYTEIRAPFNGVVSRRLVNAGDLAAPGMALVEVEGVDSFEVETGIPDSLAAGLTPGMELRVEIPSAGATLSGRLTELSSSADAQARTVPAKLQLPVSAAVRSGQFARVQVPAGEVQAVRVPQSAVSAAGQLERVYILDTAGRARLRLVKTGALREGRVEILSGLDPKEKYLVEASGQVHEGQAVEVQP